MPLSYWKRQFAKKTRPLMKQITSDSEKGYCYYVNVIRYAFYTERGKAVMKRTNEMSKLTGLSRRTLQYYDNEGLLELERSENNHRLYDESSEERIWHIMLYKEMEFKISDIRSMLLSDSKRKEGLMLQREILEHEIGEREKKLKFISWIESNGMPQLPEEGSEMTYVERIKELRKKLE